MSKELAQKQDLPVANIEALDPAVFIMKAIESNVPVETMERLLAMRAELKAEQAKEAFVLSMSGFQAECPIITKTRSIGGKYKYASMEDIVGQTSSLLQKYGFSYTVKSTQGEAGITAITVVSHSAGHSEESSFTVPIDDGYMNEIQKAGSSLTYAKRYSFCNAFGILTGDQDDDGQSSGKALDPQTLYRKFGSHMSAVLTNIDTVMTVKENLRDDNLEAAAEAWAEINDFKVLTALSLAPTKGGCFTIEESKKLQTKEFQDFKNKYREGMVYENV